MQYQQSPPPPRVADGDRRRSTRHDDDRRRPREEDKKRRPDGERQRDGDRRRRRDDDRKKGEEEQPADMSQSDVASRAAVDAVKKVCEKMKSATPETREDLKKEMDAVCAAELPRCSSEMRKMAEEAIAEARKCLENGLPVQFGKR